MSRDDRFHATRARPEAAGLSATLQHVSGWPVLSITASPQTLELRLVNRTPHTVTSGPATLRLRFRPGILEALDKIALAPQSDAQWVLAQETTKPGEDVVLLLAGVERFSLPPGAACIIRMDGFSAAADGGSRATRVEVNYSDFFHDTGQEIAGTRLIHMPVLRRHEPVGAPLKDIKTGSIAQAGPFTAGFSEGGDILNDGASENLLKLRVVNTSKFPVPLAHTEDTATRFHVSFRTGAPGAEWGVLSSDGDHLSIENAAEYKAAEIETQDNPRPHAGWQTDNHTLRRNTPGALAPGDYVEITLDVHSKALTGQAQLIVTFENLPQHDDGDLVLPVDLGAIADRPDAVHIVKPVHLTQDLDVRGDVTVAGALGTAQPFLNVTPGTFRLAGSKSSFYPVAFVDKAWADGPLTLEILRANVHTDARWHGSLMARVTCHSTNWGHGADFWALEARQYNQKFIAGVANFYYHPYHIVWLRGATTYVWHSSHPAELLSDADFFAHPKALTITHRGAQTEFAVKTKPDPGFNAADLSITQNGSQPANTPVPAGAIIMWSGSARSIPFGWTLCDGSNGTPDLTDRFIMGRGTDRSSFKGEGDRHTHYIDPPNTQTTTDGAHTHPFPGDWYKRNFDDGRFSGIDTSGDNIRHKSTESAGGHSHHVNIPTFSSKDANVYAEGKHVKVLRPRWYALCFIMKNGTRRTD